jgi:putative hydrolase of the HAD superfamily
MPTPYSLLLTPSSIPNSGRYKMKFEVIAFDADDTLWHNESLYSLTQEKLKQLLAGYIEVDGIEQRLYQTEMRNLNYFGYGIKGFALSMIETAIELTEGRITGREIQTIIDFAKEMLKADIQLLDNAEETVARLAEIYPLMMITKGDLFDQEAKITRSGLGRYFKYVEIVSEKTTASYAALLARHHLAAPNFLMVGNSLKSDILPVVELGGQAVYVPYHLTWAHETVVKPAGEQSYFQLDHLDQLPALVARLAGEDGPRGAEVL